MKNKILSIIVAAYNMEQLLPRCLDSLLQNPNEEVEILIVNDGSKDRTLSIALEYQGKYPEIIRVIDKPNGGWGTAINRGIQEAKGKYLKTLDSDDWFNSEALTAFVELLKEQEVDLVVSSYTRIYENKEAEADVYSELICNKKMPISEYLKINNYSKHLPIQALCFKTAVLKENNFTLSDRYYTDIEYNLIPLLYVDSVYFTQINLYQYYLGREGQSVSLNGYKKNWIDYIRMCEKVTRFYEENKSKMSEDLEKMYLKDNRNIIRFSYELLLSPRYRTADDKRAEESEKFDHWLKENSCDLYNYAGTLKVKKLIPYVKIWRNTGWNILKLI
jgi:Glycosyltransferases involved in cell wall biogenesis